MLEKDFQKELKREIKHRFPGSIVLKTDENYIQGFPDLLILYGKHWAALECKRSTESSRRPNQEYYIDILGRMSFAAFVSPENKEEVLHEMECAFRA